ncbi:MAG TPA: hypothetical protein VNT79_00860 [Phycisphaerae bacterium]|nr:hypothetical protein [Phycisphaerae bacterium]
MRVGEQAIPLVSKLFRANKRLQDCLTTDSAHVTPGSRGQHVSLIQYAVLSLESGEISGVEIQSQTYGPTTARTVLAYKTRRKIINTAYQQTPDNIVGRMTMAALDFDMVLAEFAEFAQDNMP